MKKYHFQLDKVLKVKTIELDALTETLNQIRFDVKETEMKINECMQIEIDLNNEYINQINIKLSGYDLNQINYKKESIKFQLKQLNLKLNELKHKEGIQLDKVIEKKKEESMLIKLDEKQYEQYVKQAHKKENELMDEMLVLKMNYKG